MTCPNCAREIPPGTLICPFCSIQIVSQPPVGVPPPPRPLAEPHSTAVNVLAGVGSALCIVLVIALSALATKGMYGSLSSRAFGYFVGRIIGAFLPPVIGLLMFKKASKKKRSPVGLLGVCCVFAFVLALISSASGLSKLRPRSQAELQQRIARLAREGTGQAPKTRNQDEFDEVIRSFFGDLKKFNADYAKEVASNDRSALKGMYGAESFRSDDSIAATLRQLNATLALEQKYTSLEPLIQETKVRLDATSLSQGSKAEFWKGFEDSVRKSLQPREELNATEQAWLKDSISLYEFMRTNERSFYVKEGKIIFASHEPLVEYNERITKVLAERKTFLATKEKFDGAQKASLSQLGLKPSDFQATPQNSQ
jgi:hypothetical protein